MVLPFANRSRSNRTKPRGGTARLSITANLAGGKRASLRLHTHAGEEARGTSGTRARNSFLGEAPAGRNFSLTPKPDPAHMGRVCHVSPEYCNNCGIASERASGSNVGARKEREEERDDDQRRRRGGEEEGTEAMWRTVVAR